MKKNYLLLGLIVIALSLSACGSNLENGRDSNGPTDSSDNFYGENTQLIKENNNSPVVGLPSIDTSTPADKNNIERVLSGQKDLFKEYSRAIIKTSEGDITVKFYPETPLTVNNFLNLASNDFYNGTKFHRIMKDFMIQGGDPLTKETDTSAYGMGGPGYKFKNEYSDYKFVAGNIAMANAGLDTNGSQFFIVTAVSTPSLDGDYTNFGEVEKGMDVVRKIENSRVTESARQEMSVPVDYVSIKSVQIIK